MKTILARRIFFFCRLMLIFFLFQFFSSCDLLNIGKEKPSKNLQTGDEIEVASESVPSSGGTFTVDDPTSVIDGLEIVVPKNSYSGSKTFKISTAEITSHNLGQYFHPITPLIQIENGGGYSDSIMEITIPIVVEEGEIPLGFFYDEIAGKLEAIPVKEYTSHSITLLTRHFMPASELSPSDLKAAGIFNNSFSNMVISSISESILKGQSIISSGFKVGTDDWEFTNYGSYLAPGGHCAGQNMAAMWYYFEKKLKGEGNLFGKFSTVPSLWQDNSIGYRFCSVIHDDLVWSGNFIDLFDKYIDKNQEMDKFKLYSIAGAMLVTGEPQGIGIYMTLDKNKDGVPDTTAKGKIKYGGHDLICYQAAVNEGKLYISDPNEPGNGQVITMKNNKFEPYIAKANGNAKSDPYPFITWYAKTAYIDWPQIGKRYTQLLDSTIGNVAPNTFPPYTIWVKGKADVQLKNGFSTNNDTLRCVVECPTAEKFATRDGKKLILFDMYDKNGTQIDNWEAAKVSSYIILKPGLNRIGFYFYAPRNGVVDEDGELIDLFVDFKWFNIYYSKLTIDPNPIIAEPGTEVTISALTGGTAPKKSKYVWNFGDGSNEITIENDSIVKHTFANEGEFEVSVSLYDNSKNNLISKASAKATISKIKDDLANLQKCRYINVEFSPFFGDAIHSVYFTLTPYWDAYVPFRFDVVTKWENTSFTLDYKGKTPEGNNYYDIFYGNMSSDAKEILTLTIEQWSYANGLEAKVVFKNIPLTRFADISENYQEGYKNDWAYIYSLSKESILSHVSDSYHRIYGNKITDPGMWGIKLYFWDYDDKQ